MDVCRPPRPSGIPACYPEVSALVTLKHWEFNGKQPTGSVLKTLGGSGEETVLGQGQPWGEGTQIRLPEGWLKLRSERPLRMKRDGAGGTAGETCSRQREPSVIQVRGGSRVPVGLAFQSRVPASRPAPCPVTAPAHDVSEPLEVGG